jgi:hypothetical protein
MNSGKRAVLGSSDRVDDAHNFLRLTLQINHWDQKFLGELATGEGKSVPGFVGDLVRKRLHEVREAAKR